jgi:transposase InsO family protein
LQFAPSTYDAAKSRPPCARDLRDEALKVEIKRVYDASFDGCYGAKKVWKQLNHEQVRVANCTVRRLMTAQGLTGVRRGRQFKLTTISDENQHRPSDLVDRQFVASAPNRLWVADLTYVKTHTGWTYVAFIIDVFSRAIVGWQASTSLRSDLAIDALEMAIYSRNGRDLSALIHHSDRGVQYLSIRYSGRLGEAEIVASVVSKGDSYDCACRVVQRSIQDRADPSQRTLAQRRARRMGHAELPRLVQQPTNPRVARLRVAGRVPEGLL